MKNILIISTGVILLIISGYLGFNYLRNQSQIKTANNSSVPPTSNNITSGRSQVIDKTYTMSEVATHNNENNCWLVINSKVYDVTTFIPQHPGGNEILKGCGKDATSLFEGERQHQENNAASYLPTYEIGSIK